MRRVDDLRPQPEYDAQRAHVAVHVLEEAFTAAGVLDMGKVKPLLYLGSDTYASVDENSVSFVKRGI